MLTGSVCPVQSPKVILWTHGHSRIQGNEDANTLAKDELNIPFPCHLPAVSILPCVGSLKTKGSCVIHYCQKPLEST
jgi:hypothetical protein